MSTEEIHIRIDALRTEQWRLAQSAHSAVNEDRLHQLDVEIHDLKAELFKRATASAAQCSNARSQPVSGGKRA